MMWQAYFRLATSLFLSTKKFISKKTNFPLDSYLRSGIIFAGESIILQQWKTKNN